MSRKSIPISGGLEAATRELLTQLHRAFKGPFAIAEARDVLGVSPERARRLLPYLASRGWLVRIRRGLYATVPLEASEPRTWLVDPWAVAARSFAPCYVGGWTALGHWGLTDQLFNAVVVFTATAVRAKKREHQGTVFRLRQIDERRIFGTRTVWRDGVRVGVSDAERTLVDVLDRPDVGGGIRHVADCLSEWSRTRDGSPEKLTEYATRFENRSVFKRLGYLLETRSLEEPELLAVCKREMSSGLSALDPSSGSAGKVPEAMESAHQRAGVRMGRGDWSG